MSAWCEPPCDLPSWGGSLWSAEGPEGQVGERRRIHPHLADQGGFHRHCHASWSALPAQDHCESPLTCSEPAFEESPIPTTVPSTPSSHSPPPINVPDQSSAVSPRSRPVMTRTLTGSPVTAPTPATPPTVVVAVTPTSEETLVDSRRRKVLLFTRPSSPHSFRRSKRFRISAPQREWIGPQVTSQGWC